MAPLKSQVLTIGGEGGIIERVLPGAKCKKHVVQLEYAFLT